ncbi:MAG: hypothetical protein NTV23_16050 [Propionibacteriales bacterium]|nr:hypothetical protein [Propionibacteriales bacterium]
MRSIVYSAVVRILGFVPQGIAQLLASHLIISHYGVAAFSSYALIIGVLMLIPLNNLGAGASMTQVVAAHGVDDELSQRTGTTAVRVLAVSSTFVVVVSAILWVTGAWPVLLGEDAGTNGFIAIAVILYGLSFIPGLGATVLLATGRNHLTVTLQVLATVLAAVLVWFVQLGDLAANYLLLVPSCAILLLNVIGLVISQRTTGFSWVGAVRRAPFRARFPGARIRAVAIPMLITSLALPVAYLSDRIVLSQVSTDVELARYALVLQLFAPVTSLIVVTSQPIWPMVTSARARGGTGPGLRLIVLGFLAGTFAISSVLVVVADPIGRWISGGDISLGYQLPALAAGATLVQAIAMPVAMTLVDPVGARLVAATTVITVPVNLVVSVLLADAWGARGPLVSLLVVGMTIQIVPWLVFSVRRSRSGEKITLL